MMKHNFSLGINDIVLVKLNGAGVLHWLAFYKNLSSHIQPTLKDLQSRADKDGFYEFQFRQFMRIFGESLSIGGNLMFESEIKIPMPAFPAGLPTHTQDINGNTICLGDTCDYDFNDDDPCPFEVVFEENAFRKKYKHWKEASKPLIDVGEQAKRARLKIVKKAKT